MTFGLCNLGKTYISKTIWMHWSFVLEYFHSTQLHFDMHFKMASAKVKIEPGEVQPSTSGRDEQGVSEQVLGQQVTGEQVEGEESYDSDQFNDEFLTEYCEMVDILHPMTISKELFYTDEMVARNYNHLSKEDKDRFNQMKVLAESIKQEMGDYGLIEDLMSRVVAQCYSYMERQMSQL